jgi:hydrogenase maturation protease
MAGLMPLNGPGPNAEGNAEGDRVLIVGCGASLRRDDQAGLRVAEALTRAGLPAQVRVKTTECPCADLLVDLASQPDISLFVIIDAAAPGPDRDPGSWRRIDARRQPERIRTGNRSNIHGLSVDAAFEIAAQMGMLPPNVWVYVVAAADIDYGEDMTPAVREAIGVVSERIADDVKAWLQSRGTAGA